MRLMEEYKQYEKMLNKKGISMYDMDRLDNPRYTITMTCQEYNKNGNRGFSKKPSSEHKEVITARTYFNYITSIWFFNDKIDMGYTCVGYIPTSLTCVSTDREIKIIRKFGISYDNTNN